MHRRGQLAGEPFQRINPTLGERIHQRAADDDAVRRARRSRGLGRCSDTKADRDRKSRWTRGSHPLYLGVEIGRDIRPYSGDAESRNQIDETARTGECRLESRIVSRRRNEANQGERAARHRLLDCRIGACRKIGEQHPGCPRFVRFLGEALHAIRQHGIEVRHDDDGHTERGLGDQLQDARYRHSLLQGCLGRALNRRTVGEGVGKRDTDFDEVRSRVGDAAQRFECDGGCGKAGRQVRNQRPRFAKRLPPPRDGGDTLRQSSR